jgi:2-beta-glucuronyltransferase
VVGLQGSSNKNIAFVSAVHDFRTLRRGSIQALASALVKLGHSVTFISVRFSLLSLLKGDSRNFLWRRANRPEWVDGVRCYLWFTAIHPFQSNSKLLEFVFRPYYFFHKRLSNRFLDTAFRDADYIVIESGQGLLLAERARRLNPRARIIYRASDKLSTIGAAEMLQSELERNAETFDWFCLLSADMVDEFAWAREKTFYLPLGIDPDEFRNNGPNPYTGPLNAVSLGSMLFDPSFFQIAAPLFPAVQFHVIGCGTTFGAPANVKFYDEMAFKETVRYIEYASFGIAPYRATQNAGYLATSSLKLKQYEYFGIPAVCPEFAVGQSLNRFGYAPGDAPSIERAISGARGSTFTPVPAPLNWQELAQRLLDPRQYADCDLANAIGSVNGEPGGAAASTPSGTGAPRCSLVLCTLGDRKKQLVRLLDSLDHQAFNSFEIIIVDQNPLGYLDDVVQSAESRFSLKHVRSDRGLSIARNVGLRHVTGDIVAFPDDDCWYFPETLGRVVAFFDQNPRIDMLLGRTVDGSGAPSLSPSRSESGSVNKSNIWVSGNSNTVFVRTNAVSAGGGFNEEIGVGAPSRFQSGEETDFILSLMESGARVVYLRDLKVGHEQVENVGMKRTLKRAWTYSQGFGYVLKKYKYGIWYLTYRLLRSFLSAAWAFVRMEPQYGLSRLLWSVGTLVGYVNANPGNQNDAPL